MKRALLPPLSHTCLLALRKPVQCYEGLSPLKNTVSVACIGARAVLLSFLLLFSSPPLLLASSSSIGGPPHRSFVRLRRSPAPQKPSVRSASSSRVILASSAAKALSSVRKSMQWHSRRSRIGTQGQFQKPWATSASLSS